LPVVVRDLLMSRYCQTSRLAEAADCCPTLVRSIWKPEA
jgi:hypothetical protein